MIELSEICATRHNNARAQDAELGTWCEFVDPLSVAKQLRKQGMSWDSVADQLGVSRTTLFDARKRGYFVR